MPDPVVPAPQASLPPETDAVTAAPRYNDTLSTLLLRPFLLPLLLLAAVGVTVMVGVNRNAQAAAQVMAAQSRLLLLDSLLRDISDLETGQRGFILTGQPDFLKPYVDGLIAFDDHTRQLRQQPAGSQQLSNLNLATQQLEQWRAQSADPEIRARRVSLQAAANLISTGVGREQLDLVRTTLTGMRGREDARLSAAVQSSTQTLQAVRWITVAGLLLSLSLLGLTVLRVVRTVKGHLSDLTGDAREIAAGQYEQRLRPSHVRELDELGAQFHNMARAVQEREQALQATNEQLSRSNRELEQFAYVASHDLQEPLRTIGSYTELLARRYQGQLDGRADQYMAFITQATGRMKALIQDLLAFSRVRQAPRVFRRVDTATLINNILTDLEAQRQDTGARVDVQPLPTVTANPDLLRHAFQNLIVNALKFHAPGRAPHVQVGAVREGGAWVFHVQDNGIGIEPQYFERIFGVFQRLHGVGEYGGSGIGLAVARSAAEQHGGDLWLDSTPGQGTTFYFRLPDRPSSQETPHP